MRTQFVGVIRAHSAACAQLATSAGAKTSDIEADWDEKDSSTLFKLSGPALFSKSSGNKIKGFVADLELYLQMCERPVHHWGYCLMASLGEEEAENLRRSYLPDAIADYAMFKRA